MANDPGEPTLDIVRRVLARHAQGVDPKSISAADPVFGPGGVVHDSLDILDALSEIEGALGVSIPDEDLTEGLFASVAGLAAYLDARKQT